MWKRICRVGMRLSGYLQERTKRIPVSRMKVSLVLFCVGGCAWFVWLAMHAEFPLPKMPLPVVAAPVPPQVNKPAAVVPMKMRPRRVGRRANWRLDSALFRRYLDSLRADSVFMDKLRRERPGLEDSLLELEQHYYHH
ncbi:MAG: hypothetical protein Q8927_19260 [Bacteroidota bacterium]|nr:hypothetical protein [Bacteroidota bacterium]MDP4260038.1 hypothetical protein [Bacteroidota bacterium]